jgi:ribose transport system permease protein
VLFRLGGPPAAGIPAMLGRLICQDLLRAGAAPGGIPGDGTSGAGGDGLIWLAECAALPRQAVTSLIARGRAAGLPVLAATTSAPVAAELADLVNVVIAHRMVNGAAASRLSAAADPATLRDGEFHILGTFIGALIIVLGFNGLNIFGAPTFSQFVFQGAILIVAVGLASLGRSLAES